MIVVVGLLGFFLMWLLIALPRGRETSRSASCQKNLMQIGVGLQLYHQANRHFPTVPAPVGSPGASPVGAMLEGLVQPDLLGLHDRTRAPRPLASPPKGVRVPGLACPSDPNAMSRVFEAPISYRANTGDTVHGQHGPFEPGRVVDSALVEAADGLPYTAGFAERLVGNGRDRDVAPANYTTTQGPVEDAGCPGLDPDGWRGDAGSDWAEPGWRSTLYNHVLTPNGSPSCIDQNGRTAAIGASSAHPGRVNVLMLDGSVRGVTPKVDLKVWRMMGTVGP